MLCRFVVCLLIKNVDQNENYAYHTYNGYKLYIYRYTIMFRVHRSEYTSIDDKNK